MPKIDIQSVIWKEGKYYVSQCLNVDVASYGKTKGEALEKLREALDLYLEEAENFKITKVERPNIISFPFPRA